jgi:hypothetical protein
MDFFSYNTLTSIPQGNLSGNEEREWEGSWEACEAIQLEKWAREFWLKGYGRVFIPSLTKTSLWWKGTRILRVYVRILFSNIPDRDPETPPLDKGSQILWVYVRIFRTLFPTSQAQTWRLHCWRKGTRTLRVYVQILWTLFPDILDRVSETPVLAETLSNYHLKVVFVAHKYLYGFTWALVLTQKLDDQSPSW